MPVPHKKGGFGAAAGKPQPLAVGKAGVLQRPPHDQHPGASHAWRYYGARTFRDPLPVTNILQSQNPPSTRLLLTDGYFWDYKKGGERFFFLTPALPAVNYPAR